MRFPDGVAQSEGMMRNMMLEEFGSLYQAIAVAVLLVFMVMAIQFESVKHSIMVMLCIPMSIIGSVALLGIFGVTLNMTSLLGFLLLVGMVVNNGILYVDTTNKYRESMEVSAALVLAAQTRLRPILMTTLTTIFATLPLAMAVGTGAEMMQGLGLVVIGGLTASTLLTLLLLPTFYLIIDGNEENRRRRREKQQDRIQKRRAKEEEKNRVKREKYGETDTFTGI
jgi:multidrug efflux pump subunit AcrB